MPAAHLDDDGASPHPAKSVVRRQKIFRDSLAQRRSALFEREGQRVHQRFLPGELIVDGRKVCQGAGGSIHHSSVRGFGLRLEPAFRRSDGIEDCARIGCVHDSHHSVLVHEHLREFVQPGKVELVEL